MSRPEAHFPPQTSQEIPRELGGRATVCGSLGWGAEVGAQEPSVPSTHCGEGYLWGWRRHPKGE